MAKTTVARKVLGSAWPRHFNKVIAETMYENIKSVGLPEWTEADQALAKALQQEVNSNNTDGLETVIEDLGRPVRNPVSGGSDDIGDISWKLPTVTLGYPSNIPGLQGHHWSNAVAMATPIAHKGVVAGAKAEAMTLLDFFLKPQLVADAKKYFVEEQGMKQEYIPMVGKDDQPAIHLNKEIMEVFKPQLEPFYYDEKKYGSYLEQLGITYPTLRSEGKK